MGPGPSRELTQACLPGLHHDLVIGRALVEVYVANVRQAIVDPSGTRPQTRPGGGLLESGGLQ